MYPIFEQVAQEEGVMLLNLNKLYQGKSEKVLCENQRLAIDPHPGMREWDEIHWGRPEIVNAVDQMILSPEAYKMSLARQEE